VAVQVKVKQVRAGDGAVNSCPWMKVGELSASIFEQPHVVALLDHDVHEARPIIAVALHLLAGLHTCRLAKPYDDAIHGLLHIVQRLSMSLTAHWRYSI